MKKKEFSVEQIVAVLKQADLGAPVAEVIRKVAISEHLLSMEEAVCWHGDGPGATDETTPRREQPRMCCEKALKPSGRRRSRGATANALEQLG